MSFHFNYNESEPPPNVEELSNHMSNCSVGGRTTNNLSVRSFNASNINRSRPSMRLQPSQLRSAAVQRGSNFANNVSASLNNSAGLSGNRSSGFIDKCSSVFRKTSGSLKNKKSASKGKSFCPASSGSVNVGASTSKVNNSHNSMALSQNSTRKKLTKHHIGSKTSKNRLMQKYKLSDYRTSSKSNAPRGRMGSKSSVSIKKSESHR